MHPTRPAFTLLELLAVTAIVSLLALAVLPGAIQRFVDAQLAGEDTALAALRQDILRSLDSSDFARVNLLPAAEAPAVVTPTGFTGNPDAVPAATADSDWFAKVATVRGTGFSPGAPTRAVQPALAEILFNRYDRVRLLVAAPVEAGRQRLLLVSVMAPRDQLAVPPNDGSAAWFDAIWNANWETRGAALPAAWVAALSPAQVAAWQGTPASGSRLARLRVVRITVPKFVVNVSNTHPSANAYVYFNADLNRLDVLAGSGAATTPPILAGRLIRILRGPSPGTATESSRLHLRDNTDVLVQ